MDLLDRGGAGRNQRRVDPVVLGPLQEERRIGAHLGRLKHDDHKPLASKCGNHCLLITATCLDPNPLHLVELQPFQQLDMTFRCVIDLDPLGTAAERHVELAFASIDPGTDHDTLGHLPRPSLVMRT